MSCRGESQAGLMMGPDSERREHRMARTWDGTVGSRYHTMKQRKGGNQREIRQGPGNGGGLS